MAGTPTWVKVFAAVALLIVGAFVVSLLLGIQHGPSQHAALTTITA